MSSLIQARDEFALLPELAAGWGFPPHTTPSVGRQSVTLATGDRISAVCWTAQAAEVVLVHRDGRDARSLDRIALALGRPAVAIDLPGQGRSDAVRAGPVDSDLLLAGAITALAPHASAIVALGSGALSSLASYQLIEPAINTFVLVDSVPTLRPDTGPALWDALARTASSCVIRSRESPVSSSDIDQLRRRSPNTRLLQLSVRAADVETSGATILANAVRAVLGNVRHRSRAKNPVQTSPRPATLPVR
jgi:pimeloyl-ACP methyl ester carboxylesterase